MAADAAAAAVAAAATVAAEWVQLGGRGKSFGPFQNFERFRPRRGYQLV